MNEELKIQRSKERIAMAQTVKDILTDPGVMAILGLVLIEYLQSSVNSQGKRVAGGGWMGEVAGTFAEVGLGGMAALSPLAKSGVLQQMLVNSAQSGKDIKSILPLLAKVV